MQLKSIADRNTFLNKYYPKIFRFLVGLLRKRLRKNAVIVLFQYCKFTSQKIHFSDQLNLKAYDQDQEHIRFDESLDVPGNTIILLVARIQSGNTSYSLYPCNNEQQAFAGYAANNHSG